MNRQRLPFSEGDRVTLCGQRVESDGRTVLRAHTITADGRTARIASRPSEHDRRSRHGMTLEGRVADVERATIGAVDYFVVRIDLRDGETRYVAFDEEQLNSMREFDVERGDRIRVRGKHETINDRHLIVADRCAVNGKRLELSAAR